MSNQKNQAETNFISIRHVAMNAEFLKEFFKRFSSGQTLKILSDSKTGPKLLKVLKNFSVGIERIHGEPHHPVSPRKTVIKPSASTSREVVQNFSSSLDGSSREPSNTKNVYQSNDRAAFGTYNLTQQDQNSKEARQYSVEPSVTSSKHQGERQDQTPEAHLTGSQRVKTAHFTDIHQGTKDYFPPRTPVQTEKQESRQMRSPQFTPSSSQSPNFHVSPPVNNQESPQLVQEKSISSTPRRLNFDGGQDDSNFLRPMKDSHHEIFASTPHPGAASILPRNFRMTIQSPNQTGIRAIEADEDLSYVEVERINEMISRISSSGDFAANKTVIVTSNNAMIAPGKYEMYRVKRIRV